MTEPESLILARLNRLQRDVNALAGRFDRLAAEVRNLADSAAVGRGITDRLFCDNAQLFELLACRYRDHEERLQELRRAARVRTMLEREPDSDAR